ncbi:MAG: DUF4852 domain-containing protein [Pseudomonadota bacterium]
MKRGLIILSVFLALTALAQKAFAENRVSEGYALTTLRELGQTMVGIGVVDIRDVKIADEYARLVYCRPYTKNYANDVEWDKIRAQIISDVVEKREYYRVMYEVHGVFKLGRYDFDKQFFPLSEDTPYEKGTMMKNVASIDLFLSEEYVPYCGLRSFPVFFLPHIVLKPNQPVTVEGFGVPMANVEGILARMEEAKNVKRLVYGRVRIRITDPLPVREDSWRIEMKGDVVAVDFFLDPEMTKPIGGVQFSR